MVLLFSDSETQAAEERRDRDNREGPTNRRYASQIQRGNVSQTQEQNVGRPERQRHRTPLSPRNSVNHLHQGEGGDTIEFNMPNHRDRQLCGQKGPPSNRAGPPKIRTPLSPRSISNQETLVERDDSSEFIVPLTEPGTRARRNRPRLSESQSGSRLNQRLGKTQDSEMGDEQGTESGRMETWPYNEHGETLKKRKRLVSP